MTCPLCIDGLLPIEWTDAPADFAVCLCPAGQIYRRAENCGRQVVPLWQLWCARWQVALDRVFLLEQVYTPQELAEAGVQQPKAVSAEAALLAAGRRTKRS